MKTLVFAATFLTAFVTGASFGNAQNADMSLRVPIPRTIDMWPRTMQLGVFGTWMVVHYTSDLPGNGYYSNGYETGSAPAPQGGFSASLGLCLEYPITPLLNFYSTVSYMDHTGTLTGMSGNQPVRIDSAMVLLPNQVSTAAEINIAGISLLTALKHKVFKMQNVLEAQVFAGPSWTWLTRSDWTRSMTLSSDLSATSPRTEIDNANAFRVGLQFGLSVDIMLSKTWLLTPMFSFDNALTNITSTDDWRINFLHFGLECKYVISLGLWDH